MILSAVKLKFLSPIHLSKGKLDTYESSDRLLRSDTLHAALYSTTMDLLGPEYAQRVLDELVVSSAFPFTEEDYWLPKPFWFQPDDVAHRKELKMKRYLTLGQFQRLMLGYKVPVSELLDSKDPQVWVSDTTQRVLIDRVNHRGTPFFVEKLYPRSVVTVEDGAGNESQREITGHRNQGLYVLLSMQEEMPWLESVFSLLGDNGIGLQRNLGNGQFVHEWDFEFPELQMPSSDRVQYWVNLSLFRPSWDEINSSRIRLDKSWYSLVKRGGWIASSADNQFATLRKKSILMFEEGSAFCFPSETKAKILIKGEVENVRPEWNDSALHNVWRSGKAIFFPFYFSDA